MPRQNRFFELDMPQHPNRDSHTARSIVQGFLDGVRLFAHQNRALLFICSFSLLMGEAGETSAIELGVDTLESPSNLFGMHG